MTHVFLLGGCTDTAVALGGASLAAPQRCRQCVPVSCASNLARSLTGACAISPGTFFLHSLPHKSGEHALAQRGWSFAVVCFSWHSACRGLVVVDFSRTCFSTTRGQKQGTDLSATVWLPRRPNSAHVRRSRFGLGLPVCSCSAALVVACVFV